MIKGTKAATTRFMKTMGARQSLRAAGKPRCKVCGDWVESPAGLTNRERAARTAGFCSLTCQDADDE